MNWIFADIQNNHNKHEYIQNTIIKYIIIQLIKYNHQIYNYTDNYSHAVINIIQCHFHAPHGITDSYTGNVQHTNSYTYHTQYAY